MEIDLRFWHEYDSFGRNPHFYHEDTLSTSGIYIGSNDSEGKEIYQYDIVECIDEDGVKSIHSIEYFGETGYPAFDLLPMSKRQPPCNEIQYFLSAPGCSLKVIGNKFENPELLK